MVDTSLSILKNFTRKLANCRYRVSVQSLINDLRDGKFGSNVDKEKKEIVNNDFVLADDFETVLESVRVIFRTPRLHLKKESVVMRAETASKLNVDRLKATFKDEKLWRVKNGEPSPEYVHSFVYEDDFAIYENRFVCFFIDKLLDQVSKKINSLAKSVETLNKQMGAKRKDSLSDVDYLEFLNEQTPVLFTDDDVNVKIIESLVKSKKWLMSLKSTPLYLACKKEGIFNPIGLKPTNILTKDTTYYNVYNFYLNYLNKENITLTEQGMYVGYITVNLFSALDELGFKLVDEKFKVGITNGGAIKFNKIEFYKDAFKIILSQREDGVLMTVNTVDNNEGNYLFKILSKEESQNIKGFNLNNYAKSFNDSDDFIKTFIVNDIKKSTANNAIFIKPTMVNTVEVLQKAVKSCLLVGVGSTFMYSRYCPVCGSNLITASISGRTCNSCKTLYHLFEYDNKGMVWFKNFSQKEK